MLFPYGKAPLALLVVAACTGVFLLARSGERREEKHDLVFATFAKNHYLAYVKDVPGFEREHGVKVLLQLVTARALRSRLQSAFLAGSPVPDVVEIVNGSMGTFTKGPLEDVAFVDLTDRLHAEGIHDRLVTSRLSLWTSRGRIFALPHDVHPVMLAYRRDLVEKLAIDVKKLDTWDAFVRVGRTITRDLDGDAVPDRYMLDLPDDGGLLDMLLCQRGGGLFDEKDRVTFDSDVAVDTVIWYIHQSRGEKRISTPCGWGQPLNKAMIDGLALFFMCPDWRTKFFELQAPTLAGKMSLVPLPAWEKGGRRTTTWGGTGLCITKACKRQKLAWEFCKFLYLKTDDLAKRFAGTNIIPPVKDAWDLPIFKKPNAYFSNLPIGSMYAKLAPETPPDYVSAYSVLARTKIREAFLDAALFFDSHGDDGLREYVKGELKRCADYVRMFMERNVFLQGAG